VEGGGSGRRGEVGVWDGEGEGEGETGGEDLKAPPISRCLQPCRGSHLRPSRCLASDPGPPGKYYPFKPPIKPESPLGKLLTSKGVKYYSTSASQRGSKFGSGRRNMSAVPATMKVA
jgi:hypothetical protein